MAQDWIVYMLVGIGCTVILAGFFGWIVWERDRRLDRHVFLTDAGNVYGVQKAKLQGDEVRLKLPNGEKGRLTAPPGHGYKHEVHPHSLFLWDKGGNPMIRDEIMAGPEGLPVFARTGKPAFVPMPTSPADGNGIVQARHPVLRLFNAAWYRLLSDTEAVKLGLRAYDKKATMNPKLLLVGGLVLLLLLLVVFWVNKSQGSA